MKLEQPTNKQTGVKPQKKYIVGITVSCFGTTLIPQSNCIQWGNKKTKFYLREYLHQTLSNGPWNQRSGYKVQEIKLAGNWTPYTKMASSG
jgi:hypothetical protein